MNMDQYTKNRFKEYDSLSKEELVEKQISLSEEILDTEQTINNKGISSEQRTEIIEDLKFLKEQLLYIDELLSNKNVKTK